MGKPVEIGPGPEAVLAKARSKVLKLSKKVSKERQDLFHKKFGPDPRSLCAEMSQRAIAYLERHIDLEQKPAIDMTHVKVDHAQLANLPPDSAPSISGYIDDSFEGFVRDLASYDKDLITLGQMAVFIERAKELVGKS